MPWYYSPKDEQLYRITQNGWLSFPKVHKRQHHPAFSNQGTITDVPLKLCRATVYQKGSFLVYSGYDDILRSDRKHYSSFLDILASSPPEEKWCLEWLDIVNDGCCLATALRQDVAMVVSDCSYRETNGTVAFVLGGEYSVGCIVGTIIVPGNAHNHSAYRSELTGIYAMMIMVKTEFACDGLSALNRAFSYVALISANEPSYGLLAAIQHQWLYAKIQQRISHVKGHQDDDSPIEKLDRWGKLNIKMD